MAHQRDDETLYQDVRQQFAEAYYRQDAAGMAALFTENTVRVTPSGIFQGRDTATLFALPSAILPHDDYSEGRTALHEQCSASVWHHRLRD